MSRQNKKDEFPDSLYSGQWTENELVDFIKKENELLDQAKKEGNEKEIKKFRLRIKVLTLAYMQGRYREVRKK